MQELFLLCECNLNNISLVYWRICPFCCNFHRNFAQVKKKKEHPRDVSMTSWNGSRYKAMSCISQCAHARFNSFCLHFVGRVIRTFCNRKNCNFQTIFVILSQVSISIELLWKNTRLVHCPLNLGTVQRPRVAIKPLISFMIFKQ